jgi:tRNA pseudouridine55 synthase
MNGVLPVDKPDGPSSHDVVAAARRALGLRRIGHTGTLDPFASGLLLLCLGPATRLAEYITGLDKTYRATARLGVATDTLDRTGAVVSENGDWEALSESRIRAAFEGQAGTRLQTPPAYSAKKIGGRKAYELARAGEAVTPDPVEVTIHSLEVTAMDGPEIRFEMRASSGTYVRAVARDAGEALGVGAHLTTLRRTAIGPHTVEAALDLADLDDPDAVARALLPPREAVGHLPAVAVDADQRRRIGHGQRLSADGGPTGVVALVHGEELVAMAESDGRTIRPRKVFA